MKKLMTAVMVSFTMIGIAQAQNTHSLGSCSIEEFCPAFESVETVTVPIINNNHAENLDLVRAYRPHIDESGKIYFLMHVEVRGEFNSPLKFISVD